MPIKMMSEAPLPMPFSVMSSPIHMTSVVPAVRMTMHGENENGKAIPRKKHASQPERHAERLEQRQVPP